MSVQPPSPPGHSVDLPWLLQAVSALFAHNRTMRRDPSGREWTYHAPSMGRFLGRYPHQWFWDSCAHAIALRHIDITLAMKELESLFAAQDGDGLIPHQVFNPAKMNMFDRLAATLYPPAGHSPFLQPSVLAQAVEAVSAKTGDRQFIEQSLPGLMRYHRYLHEKRGRGGDGLLEIIHSYESGKDRSREYDDPYGRRGGLGLRAWPMLRLVLKYHALGWDHERIFAGNSFRVKDLLFNCVYAADLGSMARLCHGTQQAEYFRTLQSATESGILGKMYDHSTGLFNSLDARQGQDRQLKVCTVSTFLPLLLESIPEHMVERLTGEMSDLDRFWLPYPLPAEPLHSPEAGWKRTGIWRGLQTWMIINWFVVRGLKLQAARSPRLQQRCLKLAEEITFKSYQLVRRSGFREYYDSLTGRGERATRFGMSALVLDMVHEAEPAPPQR
ncbi:MAG: hypothetical protein HYX90_09955 [Chloroflexi bacterium]|nr:hypothetical protein [Chloroflexota bacterium]